MNKIVVPVDFSVHSVNALKQAIKIAQVVHSKVYVVHAYPVRKRADTIMSVTKLLERETTKQIESLVSSLKDTGHVIVKTKTLKGDPVEAIEKFARKIEADLIAVAMQGEMSEPDVFLGPVSGGLVKNTEIPILLIPNGYEFKGFEHVLLMIKSLNIRSKSQLKPLKNLMKDFNSKPALLHVQTPDLQKEDFKKGSVLKSLDMPHLSLKADDLNQGLKIWLENGSTDLVCVIRRKRNFLNKLFSSKLTKKRAFETMLPMLVLKA